MSLAGAAPKKLFLRRVTWFHLRSAMALTMLDVESSFARLMSTTASDWLHAHSPCLQAVRQRYCVRWMSGRDLLHCAGRYVAPPSLRIEPATLKTPTGWLILFGPASKHGRFESEEPSRREQGNPTSDPPTCYSLPRLQQSFQQGAPYSE